MTCRVVNEACQRASETRPYGFDLTTFCTRFRRPGTVYPIGTFVRPPQPTGFEYEVTDDGQSSKKNPFSFSLTVGEAKLDGSVEWTTRDISNSSLERTIDSCEWVATGLTITDETTVNTDGRMLVGCLIGGGVAGTTYLVIARVTFSDGSVEDFGINLEIE